VRRLASARALSTGMGKRLRFRTPDGFAERRGGRARPVKVPVTGAGLLFCVGAVFGHDRRLPYRARTPSPGRLTSALQGRTAECDQPPGTESAAG
jgi:hypothetical protein